MKKEFIFIFAIGGEPDELLFCFEWVRSVESGSLMEQRAGLRRPEELLSPVSALAASAQGRVAQRNLLDAAVPHNDSSEVEIFACFFFFLVPLRILFW